MSRKNEKRGAINKFLEKKVPHFRKQLQQIWKNAKPYLAFRYWPIYLVAFFVGFYLWGPLHGIKTIQNWQVWKNPSKDKPPTKETLELELNRLKRELKTVRPEPKSPAFNPANFSLPALGLIIKGFEWMETDNAWRMHTGVDIGVEPGTNILAAAAGVVTEIKEISPENYSVMLSHGDGWRTIYTNLAKVSVTVEQQIIKGVIIGVSGNTVCGSPTPGFHFAIYHDLRPVDPQKIIPGLKIN